MILSPDLLNHILALYIWPFMRIAALVMVVPVWGVRMVPARVRILFSAMLTFIAAPSIPKLPNVDILSGEAVVLIAGQIMIGIAMGFIFKLVFECFTVGGQVIAMQTGLGFATLVDPNTHANVPVLSQFYLMIVTLTFLAINGHILVIQVLIESFQKMPISTAGLSADKIWGLLEFSGWIFKGGVIIALPMIVSLLIVNLMFGVMTRTAPQLNIFAIGFPITLTIGLIVVYLTVNSVLPHVFTLVNQGFETLNMLTT